MIGHKKQVISKLLMMAMLAFISPALADEKSPIQPDTPAVQSDFVPIAISTMAAHDTVKRQLEAIRGRNDRLAYSLNSETIQKDFDQPQDFMRMLRQKKEPLYNYVSYEFLESQPGSPYTKVSLIAPDGKTAIALFKMEQDEAGQWRTGKIILLQSDDDPI